MREIKFRAWHKGFNNVRGAIPAKMLYDVNHGDCLIWARSQPIESIMQYTGLKDKKGKEIYEGDVLAREEDDGSWEYPNRYVDYGAVEWKDSAWFVIWPHVAEDISLHDYYAKTGEIIGNIYENPELMKST